MSVLASQFVNFPQYLITWGLFFLAGVLSFAIQLVRSRSQFGIGELLRHCIPFNVWTSKSFHMDVIIYLYRKLTDFVFLIPGIAVTAAIASLVSSSLQPLFPAHDAGVSAGLLMTSICTLAMFFAAEFSDYVIHYAEHKIPALWEFHKVHHSADFLNPLTSKRGHSLPLVYGGIVAGIITGITAGILMPISGMTLAEALVLKLVASKIFTVWTLDPLKHSHIPISLGWFEKVLISPHMHQVHHSQCKEHWDKNFGTNLSVFDWLFRTAYRPVRGEKIVFGISGYTNTELQKFNTFKGAFLSPIISSAKLLNGYFSRLANGRQAVSAPDGVASTARKSAVAIDSDRAAPQSSEERPITA